MAQPETEHIVGITTKSGEEVSFDPPGGTVEQGAVRATVKKKPYRIPLQDVQRLWINSFRIAYGIDVPQHVSRVVPQYARTVEGMDVLSSLRASDDRYYSMPYTTDRAEIRFAVPSEEAGMSRTLFLHSRGC